MNQFNLNKSPDEILKKKDHTDRFSGIVIITPGQKMW